MTSSNSKLVDAIALRDEKAAFDITDMEITFSDARPSILSTSYVPSYSYFSWSRILSRQSSVAIV